MLRQVRNILAFLQAVLSVLYLTLIVLSIPLAFDVGGVQCGLAFSLTVLLLYFILTTIRLIFRRRKYFRWISIVYYCQHIFIPSLLTLFLSYYSSKPIIDSMASGPIEMWRFIMLHSTPIFTILEGFCSLLLIQAIGQTVEWLTTHKSDSWLIVSLIGSGSTITAALYFLYRIYVFPFTIDLLSASLLGSLLTLTAGIGLFGIVSGKGSIIESSLLFAYIVRCIYETFPILSQDASKALASLFTQTTYNLKNEIPKLPPQITNTVMLLFPFLAENLPGSFKTIWEFLITAILKLPLPLVLNLAYRIGVFYAATKIIPSIYHGSPYLSTPPSTPSHIRSRQSSSSCFPRDDNHFTIARSTEVEMEDTNEDMPSEVLSKQESRVLNNAKASRRRDPPSTILKLIYAYSPCIIIAVYTHLMMLYNGELGTELTIWGWWNKDSNFHFVVHPWQFWNWVNMGTTLLLYTAELLGNDSNTGGPALTSHWKIE